MTKWLPSLNSLKAFEVVSRHLNYHSAAEELRVTPAAVKQLVSKLEDSVGVKLLERSGQGLTLTPKGRVSCEELTVAMGHLYSSVEKMRSKEQSELIVSVETSFAAAWLVPKLELFRAQNPQINVLIDSTQRIADFGRDKVDVAIRYGVDSPEGFFVHRLFDDQIFPACSPSLAAGPPALRELSDLNDVPLIHWDISQLDWAHSTRKWFTWERWLQHNGVNGLDTDRGLSFNDYGLAVQAAIAGQGLLLASWPILKEPIESGLLVCPFKERTITDIGYDLVTTSQAHTRYEVKAFIDWMIDTVRVD